MNCAGAERCYLVGSTVGDAHWPSATDAQSLVCCHSVAAKKVQSFKLFVSLKVAQRLTSRCDTSASVKSGILYASHCGCSWQVALNVLQLFGRSHLTSMLRVHPGVSYLLRRPAEVMLGKEKKMIGFIFLPDLEWNKRSHLPCAGVRVFCISPAAFSRNKLQKQHWTLMWRCTFEGFQDTKFCVGWRLNTWRKRIIFSVTLERALFVWDAELSGFGLLQEGGINQKLTGLKSSSPFVSYFIFQSLRSIFKEVWHLRFKTKSLVFIL